MKAGVFPTCVGVFLYDHDAVEQFIGLPHVRGGVSEGPGKNRGFFWSSPRAWGCFPVSYSGDARMRVFPTCVGVFLSTGSFSTLSFCLPHVRGGVSVLTSSTGELL